MLDSKILNPLVNAQRLGLFCDFDGTLSRIVDHPKQPKLHPKTSSA